MADERYRDRNVRKEVHMGLFHKNKQKPDLLTGLLLTPAESKSPPGSGPRRGPPGCMYG